MFVSFLPKFYSILIAYGASGPTASGLGGVLFLMDFLFSDAASLFFFYLPLAGHRFDNETPVEEVVRAQANYTVIAHNNPISPPPPPPPPDLGRCKRFTTLSRRVGSVTLA